MDVYRESRSVEEFQQIRRALAKQANQRMVRLERGRSKITGESFAEFGAIIDAKDYLERQGRRRFAEQLKFTNDVQQLRREITILQGFLSRKSSTVKGMNEIERKRLRAFEEKGLIFANTKEFFDFLNSQTFNSLVASGFSSETIIEAWDNARERGDANKVLTNMEKALDAFRSGAQRATIKNLRKQLAVKPLVAK